ncbi:DNA sulfur modification protein DndB [Calothrix rhizosoleniae]|uniref:DNA sulfur modification protein DndB n=1 Tax=Calothrix rhizosoleniae TaxID=888997 RepID=UPI000B49D7A3|nr:DNA sulfur modification protein DndB [Calothrix rhizosoleniae]
MHSINQDSADTISSEIKAKFSSFIESFFSKHYRERCYLGLVFWQGKRRMLQINVPAGDFSGLLQAKPSSGNDPDSGKNRPEVKGHAEDIKQYIIGCANKDKPWIVGTLTANVDPDDIEIHEFARGMCLVVIPRGVKLDITDGQHRKRAIHELIEGIDSKLIANDDFPITLILEGDKRQCQIDFRDMAQTKQLDKSLLVSFGEYEGHIGITKELIDRVSMFQDKTEKVKASPSVKHKLIYTTNYIARFVSCTFTNNTENELKDYNVEQTSESLAYCLNKFFMKCENTRYISQKPINELTVDDIKEFKENGVLGVSVGLEILGRLLYSTYSPEYYKFDEEKVNQLAQLDWSRKNDLWANNIVRRDPNPKNPNNPYKISFSAGAIATAVDIIKIKLGWMS